MRPSSLVIFLGLVLSSFAVSAQPIQFEYDLKITADPAKRAAYLKQSGEAPSSYEQVFNLVKGSMQVATVVDKVDIKKDRYHISCSAIYCLAGPIIDSGFSWHGRP